MTCYSFVTFSHFIPSSAVGCRIIFTSFELVAHNLLNTLVISISLSRNKSDTETLFTTMKLLLVILAATNAIVLAANKGEEPASRGMMRGFVPKPELDLAAPPRRSRSRNARKGATTVSAELNKSNSINDACVAPPSASSDSKCARYCASEDYDLHAYADLVGEKSSSTEECLCFDENELPAVQELTKTSGDIGISLCTSISRSRGGKRAKPVSVEEE